MADPAVTLKSAVSVVQAWMLAWSFWFASTTVTVHHPWEWSVVRPLGKHFYHPMVTQGAPTNQICAFGQWAIAVPIALLVLRALRRRGATALDRAVAAVLGVAAALGLLMNLNAAVYLLPVLLLEWVVRKKV